MSTNPGAISDEYMREISRTVEVMNRARLAGHYLDPAFNVSPDTIEALSKSLDDSRDEWWGEVAQRWIGL